MYLIDIHLDSTRGQGVGYTKLGNYKEEQEIMKLHFQKYTFWVTNLLCDFPQSQHVFFFFDRVNNRWTLSFWGSSLECETQVFSP
jgi:hypothetical protein